jgi:hypothetical protein
MGFLRFKCITDLDTILVLEVIKFSIFRKYLILKPLEIHTSLQEHRQLVWNLRLRFGLSLKNYVRNLWLNIIQLWIKI